MPTVFTRKNNEFSCLYDRKLMQSYTTSQDGLTCPDKYRSQSHRVWWQMPAKQSDKTIFQTLTSCFFRNRTLYACKYASQFFCSFTIRPTWSCTYGDVCCFGAELPFTTFCRILCICRKINRILWTKLFLFRKKIARISTSQLIKSASSPVSFKSCADL